MTIQPASDRRPMSGLPRSLRLAEAYAAMDRADWASAATAFRGASLDGDAEALEGLGFAGFLMRVESEGAAYEAAFEANQRAGDTLGAGRVAMLYSGYWYIVRGQFALANGWIEKARTLLSTLPESAEHGWLSYFEGQRNLYGLNDQDAALRSADAAAAIGRRRGDATLVGMALAFRGLLLTYQGETTTGLSRLDEAATACMSGEIRDPWMINSILCSMMEACDKCRDWDRANEWFGHIADLASKWGDAQFYAQCRPHYAAVLTWRGEWQQAEDELNLAIESLSSRSKSMAVEGTVRLAELRWRQGRWEEAAALFADTEHDPLSFPGKALLALDQGDAQQAYDLCERLLSRLPHNGRIERIPALEAFARACIAKGALNECDAVQTELEEISLAVTTLPQRAIALLTMGLIAAARGESPDARHYLEDAIDLFEACAAPFEAARSRLELASVFGALGRPQDATRLAAQACTTFETLGAVREAARAQAFLRRLVTPLPLDASSTVAGLSQREVEVLGLLAGGLSNQEIADRLVLSTRTVQRHVENIYAKTGARGRAAAAVFATTHQITSP